MAEAYIRLVNRYGPDTAPRAVAELAAWPTAAYVSALRALNATRDPVASSPRAILLETETALYLSRLRGESFRLGHLHLLTALSHAPRLSALRRPDQVASHWKRYRPWYLLIATLLHAYWDAPAAADHLNAARILFKEDPAVELASCRLHEGLASRYGQTMVAGGSAQAGPGSPLPQGLPHPGRPWPRRLREVDRNLRQAEIDCRLALMHDPTLEEARVRLGHIKWAAGDLAGAQLDLDTVHATASDPFVRYMALLFLGRVLEDAQKPHDAALLYGEALELYPRGHAAFAALIHVLEKMGQSGSALAVTERMVSAGPPVDTIGDPWWWYWFGDGRNADAQMSEARRLMLDRK